MENGASLTKAVMLARLRACLELLGIKGIQFNGISFRKGGAASLHLAGAKSKVIKAMGRWRSDCYELYIAHSEVDLAEAGRAMAMDGKRQSELVFGGFDRDSLFQHR
jgi:hypothetical protein